VSQHQRFAKVMKDGGKQALLLGQNDFVFGHAHSISSLNPAVSARAEPSNAHFVKDPGGNQMELLVTVELAPLTLRGAYPNLSGALRIRGN
jgi:hypothetical protein